MLPTALACGGLRRQVVRCPHATQSSKESQQVPGSVASVVGSQTTTESGNRWPSSPLGPAGE